MEARSFIFISLTNVFVDCPQIFTEEDANYFCKEVLNLSNLKDVDDSCEILEYRQYRFNCEVNYRLGYFISPRFVNSTDARDSVISSLESENFYPFMNNRTQMSSESINVSALKITTAFPSSPGLTSSENIYLIAVVIIAIFAVAASIIIGYLFYHKEKERKAVSRAWDEWLDTNHQKSHDERQINDSPENSVRIDDFDIFNDNDSAATPVSTPRGRLSIHTYVPPLPDNRNTKTLVSSSSGIL